MIQVSNRPLFVAAPPQRVVAAERRCDGTFRLRMGCAGSRSRIFLVFVGLTACFAVASSGCRRQEPEFEVVSLEGTIEQIAPETENTGEITLRYFNEKQGQEVLGTGLVTNETEIMIDGAIAELTDLREGDKVRGEVRIDKRQGQRVNTALKIFVERSSLDSNGGD